MSQPEREPERQPQAQVANDFIIVTPDVDEHMPVVGGAVYVRVMESVPNDFRAFVASIFAIGGAPAGWTPLTGQGGGIFDGTVTVDGPTLPTAPTSTSLNNNTVTATGFLVVAGSVSHSNNFLAYFGGSGSGSYSMYSLAAEQRVVLFGHQPIIRKATMALETDEALPEPFSDRFRQAELYFGDHPLVVGSWLSLPLKVRDNAPAAYWILRKLDATRWILRLRWKDADVAVYRATRETRLPLFPLEMTLDKDGQYPGWPVKAVVRGS